MSGTVYSLVLSSEVVQAVDALAAQQGLSRSALVNHVLAEYASVASPQQHRRDILAALQAETAQVGFRAQAQSSGSLTLRTALSYKYNPALNYTVELRSGVGEWGQLRVSLRSQNEELLTYFRHFFRVWHSMEQKNLPTPPQGAMAKLEPKRYLRTLRAPVEKLEGEQAGQAIAAYISLMDRCMKTFFRNLDDAKKAISETENQYTKQLESDSGLLEL